MPISKLQHASSVVAHRMVYIKAKDNNLTVAAFTWVLIGFHMEISHGFGVYLACMGVYIC